MRRRFVGGVGLSLASLCLRAQLVVVSLLVLLLVSAGSVAQADGPNQAGLIVDFGNGAVQTYCVSFTEGSISGMDVLLNAGLELEVGFNGGTVCKVNGTGCPGGDTDCWCQCTSAPCVYWIYWHLNNGNWEYANEGAATSSVRNGDVDGWVWGEGAINAGGVQPPDITFEDICVPPAADTPVPPSTSTSTPVPTGTPKPTEEPELPAITHFTADRSTINAGESVTLSWDLHDAQGAYLRVEGVEEGVVAPGSKTVTPATTTVYTLIARNDDGQVTAEMTITVNPASATPVPSATPLPTDIPPPTDTPIPANAATPTTGPPATDTPAPTPVPVLANTPPATDPTHTPPPGPTATWLPAITPTPAAVAAATSALFITRQITPGALVRDTAIQQQPAIPVIVLAVIGVIAVVGGLGGLLVIASTARQGQRRG